MACDLEKKYNDLKYNFDKLQKDKFWNDVVPKSKIENILNNNYRIFHEGNADSPDFADYIKGVKYIKAELLEELLKENGE